jgi:hypothetical protein
VEPPAYSKVNRNTGVARTPIVAACRGLIAAVGGIPVRCIDYVFASGRHRPARDYCRQSRATDDGAYSSAPSGPSANGAARSFEDERARSARRTSADAFFLSPPLSKPRAKITHGRGYGAVEAAGYEATPPSAGVGGDLNSQILSSTEVRRADW